MYGPMSGASKWMMTMVWDGPHLLLLWAMWAVMMAGMMLPSATPVLMMYGGAARNRDGGGGGGRSRLRAGRWVSADLGGVQRWRDVAAATPRARAAVDADDG